MTYQDIFYTEYRIPLGQCLNFIFLKILQVQSRKNTVKTIEKASFSFAMCVSIAWYHIRIRRYPSVE